MSWWLWLILGLALLGVEVLTPGAFFFLFFGLAGILTALLSASGLAEQAWTQGLFFAVASLLALVLFRMQFKSRFQNASSKGFVELAGEAATLRSDLAPGGTAQAEFRGTIWNAKSQVAYTLRAGQACRVDHVEGLTLWLSVENSIREE